jgi:hypothetical protein
MHDDDGDDDGDARRQHYVYLFGTLNIQASETVYASQHM